MQCIASAGLQLVYSSHGTSGSSVVPVVIAVVIPVVLAPVALLIPPVSPLVLSQVRSEATDDSADCHVTFAGSLVVAELATGKTTDQSAGYTDTKALEGGVEVLVEFATDA